MPNVKSIAPGKERGTAIAAELAISVSAVAQLRRRLGIERSPRAEKATTSHRGLEAPGVHG